MTRPGAAGAANPDIFTAHSVPENLRPYVRRIVAADSDCQMDFAFNVYATGYCYLGWVWRGRWQGSVSGTDVYDTNRDGPLFCSGQVLGSPIVGRVQGQPRMIFVELEALGLFQLLNIPGADLVEKAVAPQALNPNLIGALAPLEQAGPDQNLDQGIARVIDVLGRLAATAQTVPVEISHAVRKIESADGAVQLGTLCADLGMPVRTFRRRFQQLTGITPKRFCRILQVTRAFNAILSDPAVNLAEISLKAGFSDQAHFNRAFREFLNDRPLRFSNDVEATLRRFVGNARDGG